MFIVQTITQRCKNWIKIKKIEEEKEEIRCSLTPIYIEYSRIREQMQVGMSEKQRKKLEARILKLLIQAKPEVDRLKELNKQKEQIKTG